MDFMEIIYNIPAAINAIASALISSLWGILVCALVVGLIWRVMHWVKPKKKTRSRRRPRKA
jgi:hypothetical protein